MADLESEISKLDSESRVSDLRVMASDGNFLSEEERMKYLKAEKLKRHNMDRTMTRSTRQHLVHAKHTGDISMSSRVTGASLDRLKDLMRKIDRSRSVNRHDTHSPNNYRISTIREDEDLSADDSFLKNYSREVRKQMDYQFDDPQTRRSRSRSRGSLSGMSSLHSYKANSDDERVAKLLRNQESDKMEHSEQAFSQFMYILTFLVKTGADLTNLSNALGVDLKGIYERLSYMKKKKKSYKFVQKAFAQQYMEILSNPNVSLLMLMAELVFGTTAQHEATDLFANQKAAEYERLKKKSRKHRSSRRKKKHRERASEAPRRSTTRHSRNSESSVSVSVGMGSFQQSSTKALSDSNDEKHVTDTEIDEDGIEAIEEANRIVAETRQNSISSGGSLSSMVDQISQIGQMLGNNDDNEEVVDSDNEEVVDSDDEIADVPPRDRLPPQHI